MAGFDNRIGFTELDNIVGFDDTIGWTFTDGEVISNFILTENNEFLITEAGDNLII